MISFKNIIAGGAMLLLSSVVNATMLQVTISGNAPQGGVALTPIWVGFHNGNFDSYDGGSPTPAELEPLIEDGATGPISAAFLADQTLVPSAIPPVGGTRVDATLGGAPLLPGFSVSQVFDLSIGDHNYFSYASMVLPTNDYFVANGNPLAHSVAALLNGSLGSLSFEIGLPGSVNDGGTEENDFATSAGNPLFGIPGGQMGPNQGADENGVVMNVLGLNPLGGFANQPPGGLDPALDFNNPNLYPLGIATVTITRVPEPGTLGLMSLGILAVARRRLM